jgi:hypothetical protein
VNLNPGIAANGLNTVYIYSYIVNKYSAEWLEKPLEELWEVFYNSASTEDISNA